MDAVKFLETRNRMCTKLACYECPLSYEKDGFMVCKAFSEYENYEEAVQIVEEWEKNNPVKTRQSEFLKLFPNADISLGVMQTCPKSLNCEFPCRIGKGGCADCCKEYWLAEVE